jgi:hypothetical protein
MLNSELRHLFLFHVGVFTLKVLKHFNPPEERNNLLEKGLGDDLLEIMVLVIRAESS